MNEIKFDALVLVRLADVYRWRATLAGLQAGLTDVHAIAMAEITRDFMDELEALALATVKEEGE